jgi:hypothetical protein
MRTFQIVVLATLYATIVFGVVCLIWDAHKENREG